MPHSSSQATNLLTSTRRHSSSTAGSAPPTSRRTSRTSGSGHRGGFEVVERDDGFIFAGDPSYYLAPFRRWWPQERRGDALRPRSLDVGCEAGRVTLHLQDPWLRCGRN